MTLTMNKETLEEYSRFIRSDKFVDFLLSNITDFAVAALILQTLNDKEEEFQDIISGVIK